MKQLLSGLMLLLIAALPVLAGDDSPDAYPKPSPFPVSWELKFVHSIPRRMTIVLPGDTQPNAYWYFVYSVLNNSDQATNFDADLDKERTFYPEFVMRTQDGKLIEGNDGIHPAVFDAIKSYERNPYLEEPTQMGGKILLGQDQVRQSVAIWAEPMQRMGSFQIFVSGLWGESAVAKDADGNAVKDANGNDILLHKTLMMSYHVDGDATHYSVVRKVVEQYVMR
jgi:hypothetical protein